MSFFPIIFWAPWCRHGQGQYHTFHSCSIIPSKMQCVDSKIAEWKVWGNVPKTFSKAQWLSQVTHTLKSDILDTLRKARGSICSSTSSTRISTRDSESRGEHRTHRYCYITSMMLSLLGFLSHGFMLSLARRVMGRGLGILGCFAISRANRDV